MGRVWCPRMGLDTTWNPNRLVPFDLYLSKTDMSIGLGWNNAQDLTSAEDYWVSFVLAGYQAAGWVFSDLDNDPDPQVDNSTYPNQPYWGDGYEETLQTGWTQDSGNWDSVIFRATIVDYPKWAHFEDQNIAHEIGHSAGNAGSVAGHHAEGGLMRESLNQDDTKFTGATLKRFREANKW